jgi:tetratricopeptide (TPR) repeat protein
VYPYYHRKYIFVSLGGYWPTGYGYVRYHWYPSHFYNWYGYNPIARQVGGDTNNYYTYNYYGTDNSSAGQYNQSIDGVTVADHTTFADVREKLADQQTPDAETLADTYFDEGIKAFESGDYALAADKFAAAAEFAPEDMILPFAYAQALFADARHMHAVLVIRKALEKTTSEELGVFYPRGLYPDDEVLLKQIDVLAGQVELSSHNPDLQLLLGYHLLGTGEIEASIEPLTKASQDTKNATAAALLIELAGKLMAENQASE